MDKEHSFKVGDCVELNSGGPRMTIEDLTEDDEAHCIWFVGTEGPIGHCFAQKTLRAAPEVSPERAAQLVREAFGDMRQKKNPFATLS